MFFQSVEWSGVEFITVNSVRFPQAVTVPTGSLSLGLRGDLADSENGRHEGSREGYR